MKLMTQGKPMKLIVLFMIPFLIGNIFQEIYVWADQIIVGQLLGVDALAGVSCANVAVRVFTEFVLGLNSGFVVVFAQEFGAGNKTGVKKSVATSMFLALVLSIAMVLISTFSAKSLLSLINTPKETLGYALDFMLVSCAGLPTMMAYNLFAGISRALGNSKIPLFFLILTSILNVGFDYFNVFVLDLGVVGVAFSTVISQVISSVLCAIYVFKKYRFVMPGLHKYRQSVSWLYVKKFFKIALPVSLNHVIGSLAVLFFSGAINILGVDACAGYSVAKKIDGCLVSLFVAASTAVSTYISQNFGAKKIKRVTEGVRAGIVIGMASCVIFGMTLCVFWDQFVGLFVAEDELGVKAVAKQYMQIVISAYSAYCLSIIFRTTLQALGKTIIPLFVNGVEIFVRSVVSSIFVLLFGYVGACCVVSANWIVSCLIVVVSYIFTINKLEKKFAAKSLG